MKSTISELKLLCILLLDRVKKIEGEEIVLDDYYLAIGRLERQNLTVTHPECTIGSLQDDIDGLRDVLSGKYDPTSLDLERLGQIFISLGQHIEQSPDLL